MAAANGPARSALRGNGSPPPAKSASRGQVLAALGAGGLMVALIAAPYSDPWREARYRKLPSEALAREAAAHGGDPLLMYWHGRRLNEAGRYGEASAALEQAARLDPGVARVRDAWAQAQVASGRAGEAYSQLKQFTTLHPDDPQGHLLLGKLHVTLGADSLAETSLQAATRLDPRQAEAWALLGDVYHRADRQPEAIEALRRALKIEPERASTQAALGVLLAGREPQAASAAFENAVRLEPGNAVFRREWADFLYNQGRLAEAEVQARESLRLDAGEGRAHLVLGRCLTERGALSDARHPLEEAARLLPFAPQPAQTLHRFYQRTGEPAKATYWERQHRQRQAVATYGRTLSDALLKQPRDVNLNRKMARHQAVLGDVEQCVHYTAVALGLPPDAPAVTAAVAADLRAAGRSDQALALERQMLSVTPDSVP